MKSPFYANIFPISNPFPLWLPLVPGVAKRSEAVAVRGIPTVGAMGDRLHSPPRRPVVSHMAAQVYAVYVDNRRHPSYPFTDMSVIVDDWAPNGFA